MVSSNYYDSAAHLLMKSFLFFEHSFAQKYYDQYAALMPWNQQNNYYYNGPVIGMISNGKTDVLCARAG